MLYLIRYAKYCYYFDCDFGRKLQIFVRFISSKMFAQYRNQLLSIILCSTSVNFHLSVILYGAFINERRHLSCKKSCSGIAQRNKYTCLVCNTKCTKIKEIRKQIIPKLEENFFFQMEQS
jgi:hypothetical protein